MRSVLVKNLNKISQLNDLFHSFKKLTGEFKKFHQIFNISVVQGTPQSFKAFAGSPVKVSGTGTIV